MAQLVFGVSAYAAPAYTPKVLHEKDWQVVCDNTHRCVAAGYSAAGATSNPAAVIIYREAGPASRPFITVKTQFRAMYDNDIVLRVGTTEIMSLKPNNGIIKPGVFINNMSLTKEQEDALLSWILKTDEIEVSQAGSKLFISMAGAKEVLLQMDAWQGRINTRSALAQRGNKADDTVLKPAPLPVLRAIEPSLANKPGDALLAQTLLSQVAKNTIDPECLPEHDKTAKVNRLTDDKVLLSLTCPKRFYSSMTHNWIAHDKAPHRPVAIDGKGMFILIQGGPIAARGYLRQTTMARNTDDCYDEQGWVFTGKDFSLEDVWTTGLCRGFAYGVTPFFSYRTKLKD